MTVKEYIQLLKKFPQDLEVVIYSLDNDACRDGWVDEVGEPELIEWTPPIPKSRNKPREFTKYVVVG